MSIIVEIPEIGEVEFPESMTPEEVKAAIQKITGKVPERQTPQDQAAPAAPIVAPAAPAQAPTAPIVEPPAAPRLFAPRVKVQQDTLPYGTKA